MGGGFLRLNIFRKVFIKVSAFMNTLLKMFTPNWGRKHVCKKSGVAARSLQSRLALAGVDKLSCFRAKAPVSLRLAHATV